MHFTRIATVAVIAIAISACSNATQSVPPTASAGNASTPIAGSMDSWNHALTQNALPSAGCFKATYPAIVWTRIACSTPPHLLFPMPKSRHPKVGEAVGDGADYTIDTTPNLISQAVGAFPKTKDVKSVQSEGCCGYQGENSYSLQLNSYFFTTSACGNIENCAGWEQFVYSNPPGSSEGQLFIQDWLVPTEGSELSGCPPNSGWEYVQFGCVQNSPNSVNIPNISVTQLHSVVETGEAASSGDSIYLSVGKTAYGMKNVQSDGITDLSAHWMGSEFNIIGNAGGDVANFNSGAKITVSIAADDGVTTTPTCPANTGTTGESNNLYFVKAPKKPAKLAYPSIEFTMSSKSGGTGTCDAIGGK